ncbi:transposase [Paenibacillus sp. WC2504]|uniref:transposase n=1 Tax=Paenibacillus sp. WC2504 TaxID=3461403 RepID=UPI0040453FF3
MEQQFMDLSSYTFRSEEECEEFLLKMRWANGFCCPRCDHNEAFKIRTRKLLECKECRMQVSLTAGTLMHKSKLPLLLWFQAIQFLFKEGVECTASILSHALEINYRSAQLLLKKIQFAFEYTQNRTKLLNKLEVSNHESQKSVNLSPTDDPRPCAPTPLTQKNPSAQDLHAYLASKLNRLNTKLTIYNNHYSSSQLGRYIKDQFNGKHDRESLLIKWIKMAISNYFYPTFLKCFHIPE